MGRSALALHALFERLAIDVLHEATVRGATRILRISWDVAWQLIEHAVVRGLRAKEKRVPASLGVDKKAISKWARYNTLVCDLDTSTVQYVAGARRKIVFDHYHIMSYMNEAVDDVRTREHREYRARGDETLARSRHLWLYAQERLPPKHQERFAPLRAMNLKTWRACTHRSGGSRRGQTQPAGCVWGISWRRFWGGTGPN